MSKYKICFIDEEIIYVSECDIFKNKDGLRDESTEEVSFDDLFDKKKIQIYDNETNIYILNFSNSKTVANFDSKIEDLEEEKTELKTEIEEYKKQFELLNNQLNYYKSISEL